LAENAIPRLEEFKPQELSNMLWGFATNGFFHEAFFTRSSMVVQRMPLQSQHLANILWAFVRARPHHPVTASTILMLLPSCTRQLETFKPQEVSSTALAVAKAFGAGDDLERPLAVQSRLLNQNLTFPSQIQDFFKYAMPWALPRLREFSAQSLANTVSAFALVRTPGDVSLFIAVGKEVHERYHSLEPTALLHLLKGFSSAPQDLCGGVVKFLAKGVSYHIDNFRPQEIQTLSRICINLLNLNRNRDLSSDELRSCCASIANMESLPLPLMVEERAEHLHAFAKLEDSSPHTFHEKANFAIPGICGPGGYLDVLPACGFTQGKILALDSVLGGSYIEGNLPSMPANALYESDFHFTGRPPPEKVANQQQVVSSSDDIGEELEFSAFTESSSFRDLSPHNRQIGIRPEFHASTNPSERNWKARKDARHNPKAIRNQRIPANYAELNNIGDVAQNALLYDPSRAIGAGSFPHSLAVQLPDETSVPIPMLADNVAWEEYDAAKEFKWKFSIKNSFFHVGGRDNLEGQVPQREPNDDGASLRSSSLPNRVRREDNRVKVLAPPTC
jgi:hypothetical protein